MPAHPQGHARTIGVAGKLSPGLPPPTRSNARLQRAARPRAATIEGERRVLAHIANAVSAQGYRCTTLQILATEVGLTKEALRLRVDALRADGRLRREPCWCGEIDTPHVRFYPPSEGGAAHATAQSHAAAPSPRPVSAVQPSPASAWQIRQLLPAQPDTWALYRLGGSIWRDPVVAWGIWEETRAGQTQSVAGPLVYDGAELEPAAASAGYVGIRIGGFRCIDGERSFEGIVPTED